MKYIRKAGCPHAYSQWCSAVSGTSKSDWREVPLDQKTELLKAMNKEQGWLCAYTLRRIDADSSHVEHIKPQSRCRADVHGSDLDHSNLVACFPRDGMKTAYRYGAQLKDSWWDDDGAAFVSPLQSNCESFFRCGLNGKIKAVRNRAAAETTIEVLGLNHDSLKEDRRRVIEEFVYGPTGTDPISLARTRRALDAICDREPNGRFYEFCVAIRDALEEYLSYLQKRSSKRKQAIRRSRNRA